MDSAVEEIEWAEAIRANVAAVASMRGLQAPGGGGGGSGADSPPAGVGASGALNQLPSPRGVDASNEPSGVGKFSFKCMS
eukprot:SAG22_NODE_9528_length_585_cov_0.588477_2_plen_79_part_01